MSAEPMFDDMHAELFDAFGQDGTVVRGSDAAVDVRVVMDRHVAQFDDMNNVVRHVDVASFLATQWQPLQGDVLTITSGSRRIDAIESDDGFVVQAVLYG